MAIYRALLEGGLAVSSERVKNSDEFGLMPQTLRVVGMAGPASAAEDDRELKASLLAIILQALGVEGTPSLRRPHGYTAGLRKIRSRRFGFNIVIPC
jgi:hypothetical protein